METLIKLTIRCPLRALVRVYYSIHPILDIEGIFLCFKCYVVFKLTNRHLTTIVGHMARLVRRT